MEIFKLHQSHRHRALKLHEINSQHHLNVIKSNRSALNPLHPMMRFFTSFIIRILMFTAQITAWCSSKNKQARKSDSKLSPSLSCRRLDDRFDMFRKSSQLHSRGFSTCALLVFVFRPFYLVLNLKFTSENMKFYPLAIILAFSSGSWYGRLPNRRTFTGWMWYGDELGEPPNVKLAAM